MSNSGSSAGSDVEDKNKKSKKKVEKKTKKRVAESGSEDEGVVDPNPKASGSKKAKKDRQKNSDGDEMIPFAKNRFVTVREYRGKVLIDLREYYEKDGQTRPGNKGISLTAEQYQTFKGILGEIDEKLAQF